MTTHQLLLTKSMPPDIPVISSGIISKFWLLANQIITNYKILIQLLMSTSSWASEKLMLYWLLLQVILVLRILTFPFNHWAKGIKPGPNPTYPLSPSPPPPPPQKRGIIPLLYFNSNISVIPIPLFLFRPPTTPPTTRDTKTLNKTNEYSHPRRQSPIESQVYIYCVTNYRVARNFLP